MNRNGSAEIDECSLKDFGIRKEAEKPLVCVQGLGFVGAAMSVATAASCDKKGVPFFNVVGLDLDNDSGCRRVSSINQGAFLLSLVISRCISKQKAVLNEVIYERPPTHKFYKSLTLLSLMST